MAPPNNLWFKKTHQSDGVQEGYCMTVVGRLVELRGVGGGSCRVSRVERPDTVDISRVQTTRHRHTKYVDVKLRHLSC